MCTGSTRSGVCTLAGALAAGDVATVDVEVQIPSSATGDVVNTAAATSGTTDPNPANNTDDDTSTLSGEADLGIVKSHTGTPIAGNNLVFTLAVHNAGPSDTPGSLQVSDALPPGMSFVSASGNGWTCASTVGDVVTCDHAAGLVSGADAAPITLTVHIGQGAGSATFSEHRHRSGSDARPDPGQQQRHRHVRRGGPGERRHHQERHLSGRCRTRR